MTADLAHTDLATVPMTWATLVRVCQTELVPSQYRNRPDAALGAILMGRELKLQPMQSLSMIDVIDGKPSLSAELMNAMVRKAGHSIRVDQYTTDGVTLTGTRSDTGDTAQVSFAMTDAEQAGLASKSNWKRYPADMCWARAISRLCRVLFPDVFTQHAYTPADLDPDAAPESPPSDVIEAVVVESQETDHLVPETVEPDGGKREDGHTTIPSESVGGDTADIGAVEGNLQPAGETDTQALDREQLEVQLTELLAVNIAEGTMVEVEATLRALCRIAGQLGVVHGRGQIDYLHAGLADVGAAHVSDLRKAELVRLAQSIRAEISDKFIAWIVTTETGDSDAS